jgi:RNA polymerase sigma-70 factor (ECF subfamily)
MARVISGDRRAFDILFTALWPSVHRFCLTLLVEEADADDAAQLVMEKLFVQAHRYNPEYPVMAWALSIARWECKTILRRRTRSRTGPLFDTQTLSDQSNLAERSELQEALMWAISELSASDQKVILESFWTDELNPTRDAAFRKRKQRAMERLRKVWRQLYGD